MDCSKVQYLPVFVINYPTLQMVNEVKEKFILHWNYRGFTKLPEVVRNYGAHIEEVYLKYNLLSNLPLWIAEMSNITNLYLHGNQIESVPDELGEVTHLTILDLGNNKLKTLPPRIGKLQNLKVLLLNENSMRILPSEINRLTKLETLSVSGNKLVALPEWLGYLPSLQELIADHNCLIEIPNSLTLAPNLCTISICSNRLQHLPLNGFLAAPCIQFDNNSSLNYLSIPVSYQLSQQNHSFQNPRDIPAYRCSGVISNDNGFWIKSKLSIHLKVEILGQDGKDTTILKLPRQLVAVHNIDESGIPSLLELALRDIYCKRFNHTSVIDHTTLEVKVNRAVIDQHNEGSELTRYLNDILKNGPISICLGIECQQPIFTEAWITVNCDPTTTFLRISTFCSRKCALNLTTETDAPRENRRWYII